MATDPAGRQSARLATVGSKRLGVGTGDRFARRGVATLGPGPAAGGITAAEELHTGWALTTLGPGTSAEAVYAIMRHRWDEENQIFRQAQSGWHLGHCFGHTAPTVEALIGLPRGALTIWSWWQHRHTPGRAAGIPQVALIERARDDVGRLRHDWRPILGAAP